MALKPFDYDMDIIAKLDDEPNDVGGLESDQLKAAFDEGGKALQDYINNVLIPYLDAMGYGHHIEDGDAVKLPTCSTLRFLNSRLNVEDDTIVIDPNGKDGESAYDAAKKGGYTGTEQEFNADLAAIGDKADITPKTMVSFEESKWAQVDVGYKQEVSVTGGNAKTLVSLQPTPAQLAVLSETGVALMVNNDNGTFYAYAIGEKPSGDMTIQATLTEVDV